MSAKPMSTSGQLDFDLELESKDAIGRAAERLFAADSCAEMDEAIRGLSADVAEAAIWCCAKRAYVAAERAPESAEQCFARADRSLAFLVELITAGRLPPVLRKDSSWWS